MDRCDEKGKLKIRVNNLYPPSVFIYIFDASNGNQIYKEEITIDHFISPRIPLNPGQYFFEIQATPDEDSWEYPYNFTLEFEPDVVVSTHQLSASNYYKVAPNPVKDHFTISSNSDSSSPQNFEFEIYDLNGKALQLNGNGMLPLKVNTTSLKSGMYLLKIRNEDGISVLKLVKE